MKPAARRWNLAGQMPLVSLILLCAATALLTNRFLSPFNLTNILVQSSIMAVIAMGMTFVIIGGCFDLSVGSTAALSGCVASMVMLEAGIAAGVVAGVITGAAVGLANGLVIAFLNVNPFITTLGTMVLIRGVVFLITGGAPVSGETGLPGEFIAFGSERLLGIHYLVWIPAVLLAVLSFVMHATPYGRRIYATGRRRKATLSREPVGRDWEIQKCNGVEDEGVSHVQASDDRARRRTDGSPDARADGARDRPAEDHHRRFARAGRQSLLYRHAARHS